ncbi:MAG: hypothetical protein ACI8PZ_000233 [Myxococcota bacterium]|jgi:hypothetical protein
MEQQSNPVATVALAAGITVWVVQVLLWCVGLIPVVNMITLVLGPLAMVLFLVGDLVAIGAGVVGRQRAQTAEVGGGAAIAGLVLGVLHVLFYVAMIGFMVLLGGGFMFLGLLGAATGNG